MQRSRVFAQEQLDQLKRNPESITDAAIVGFQGISLTNIIKCRNLESLKIRGFYHTGANPEWADTIADYSPLTSLPLLHTLSIHDCRHFDEKQLAIIAGIAQLRALSITTFMQTITNYDGLRSIPQLVALQLTCVSDLSFLEDLPNLEHLFVSDKWASKPLRNIQTLTSLSRLKSLTVNSCHHRAISVTMACPVQFSHGQDAGEHKWWKQFKEGR